jgi:dihydrofolate reductase
MQLVLVAAIADNGAIGRAGDMPWRLKADLAHFRAVTMGKPVVMGRKTYVSIGKPLKGRTTIVVSRDPSLTIAGALVAPSLPQALAAARGDALRRSATEIVIAGGADIYAQVMPMADRLDLTHVRARPEGDTFFPQIDPQIWRETDRKEAPVESGQSAFVWVTYERRGAGAAVGEG